MKLVSRVCENCGEKIFGDEPKGLCLACVLETGLGPLADEAVAGFDLSAVASAKADDPGRVDKLPRDGAPARAMEISIDFGDYELLEEIGRGGQGVVYRARQKSLNRTVALKVIGLGQWATKAHVKRFRREAEARHGLSYAFVLLFRLVLNRFDCGSQRITCLPNFALKFFLTRFSTVSFRWHDIFSYFPSKQPSKIVPSEIPCRA